MTLSRPGPALVLVIGVGNAYRGDDAVGLVVAEHPVPASLGHRGTHGAGVAEAVELARALDRLPARLICYGIEGGSFTVGAGLSPAVRDAVTEVCHQLLAELGHADDRA